MACTITSRYMTPSVASISWIRNETDILEAFVRHHATIVRTMDIVLHQSGADAQRILVALQQEELPVAYTTDTGDIHRQSAALTQLLHIVGHRADPPDWILPLDGDEFLVPIGGISITDALGMLPTNVVTLIPWRTYVPHPSDDQQERNVLRRITCRRATEPMQYYKVLIPRAFHSAQHALPTGNHALIDTRSGQACQMQATSLLALAHFPIRSAAQLRAKIVQGWTSHCANPARLPGECFHWEQLFAEMRTCAALSAQRLRDIALTYASLAHLPPPTCIEDAVPSDFPIRYTCTQDFTPTACPPPAPASALRCQALPRGCALRTVPSATAPRGQG